MNAAKALRADVILAAKDRGITTKSALAALLGVTPQYFNDVLHRKGKRFTPAMVKTAASKLKVDAVRADCWHALGAIESGWKIGPARRA